MKHLAFLLGFLFCAFPAYANMYLVRNIPVDVTDENATIAREKAITEAQEKAFYHLLERLTLPMDVASLPVLTTEDMLNLVQDYSVANEKTSSVRYIADVSVQFNPDAIQTFFQEYKVPYITSSAEKSIILPVYRPSMDATPMLWQDSNIWLNAWKKTSLNSDLVPLVVPMGDLTDMSVISEDTLSKEMDLDISSLYSRYQALQALVIEADVNKDLHQIKITIRPFKNAKSYVGEVTFTEPIDAPAKAVLERAAQKAVLVLEKKWREKNAVRFDNPSSLVTVVPIRNLAEWIQIRGQLDQIKLIKQYVVKAVRKDQAQIEIFFAGNLAPFLDSVQREGLFLSPAKGDLWSLRDLKDVPPEEVRAFVLPEPSQQMTQSSLPPVSTEETPQEDVIEVVEESAPEIMDDASSIEPMHVEGTLIPSATQPETAQVLEEMSVQQQEITHE